MTAAEREPDDGTEIDDDDEMDLDFCVTCLDTFRYDDCGGYNPPCECGMHCRSCHKREEHEADDDFDHERDEEDYPDDE